MYNEELKIKDRLKEILIEALVVSAINEDLPKLKTVIEEILKQYS